MCRIKNKLSLQLKLFLLIIISFFVQLTAALFLIRYLNNNFFKLVFLLAAISVILTILTLILVRYLIKPIQDLKDFLIKIDVENVKLNLKVNDKTVSELNNVFSNLTAKLIKEKDKIEQQRKELESLNEITKEINSSLDFDNIFEKIVTYLYATYDFNICSLVLVEENTKKYRVEKSFNLKKLKQKKEDEVFYNLPLEKGDLISDCILNNELFIKSLKSDLKQCKINDAICKNDNLKTLIIIPVSIKNKVIGAMIVASEDKEINITDDDINSIKRFVNQIAVSLNNAWIYEELKSKKVELEKKDKEISDDLYLAKKIQKNFLSSTKISEKNLKIDILYQPMIEIGGDIYDILEVEEKKYYRIFLADATGHGIQAALITMLIKNEYDKIKAFKFSPKTLLRLFNETFINNYSNLQIYFTCIIIDIDIENKRAFLSSAGHHEQFLIKNNEIIEIDSKGKIIGMTKDNEYETLNIDFSVGDKLFLFTDGIYEIFNNSEDFYGIPKIQESLKRNINKNSQALISSILKDAKLWMGKDKFEDDVTLLCIENIYKN